jgi:hypothetical protein
LPAIAETVLGPGDAGYDEYRSPAFDRSCDRPPSAVAVCRDRDDVRTALEFASERELPTAVRCGGASEGSTVEAGLVIDVSPLKSVEVDPVERTARVGGGVTWAELDAATQEHGLAVTGARVSSLGVAGVALGAGSGWLERSLGPTYRSVTGAEMVLADGRTVTADGTDNAELLHALRMGEGHEGVVTELSFRLHPVGPELLAGFLGFHRSRAGEVGRAYRDFMESAPPEVGGGLVLDAGAGGTCTIVFCFRGPIDQGESLLEPLRELGPSLDAVTPTTYLALQTMTDTWHPPGTRGRFRAGLLRELPDEALGAAIDAADRPAASLCRVLLRPLGGAIAAGEEVPAADALRDASWAFQCTGQWPPLASLDAGNIAWVEQIGTALRPFSLNAAGDR